MKRSTDHLGRDRQRLAEWLHVRHIDGVLAASAFEETVPAPLRYERPPRRRTPEMTAGGIYLLRPTVHPRAWGPVYVVVLEERPGNKARVAPFSRYDIPAVPGEWQSGLKEPSLRVLCFWNVQDIHPERLLPGRAKQWPARSWAGVLAAYRHVIGGGVFPADQQDALGPPLVHPADPRYEYLEEERQRLDDHVGTPETNDREASAGHVWLLEPHRPAWLLAAEGRPPYGAGD